jgi:hypothetical protein
MDRGAELVSIEGGDSQIDFPESRSFLQLISEYEAKCQSRTWSALPCDGRESVEMLRRRWRGARATRFDGAPLWGCHQGDHRGAFLLDPVASSAYAALRLSTAGNYDEALSIVRTLGENAILRASLLRRPALEALSACQLDHHSKTPAAGAVRSPSPIRGRLARSPRVFRRASRPFTSGGADANLHVRAPKAAFGDRQKIVEIPEVC